jgi:hypothetical protein
MPNATAATKTAITAASTTSMFFMIADPVT